MGIARLKTSELLWLEEFAQKKSYQAIGEFWDKHDLGDFWDRTLPAHIVADIGAEVILPAARLTAVGQASGGASRGIF